MDRHIISFENYSIWQLGKGNIQELAEFVVYENYMHHEKKINYLECARNIELVYQEELNFLKYSEIFVARNHQQEIIASIRVMLWDGMIQLPLEKLFHIKPKVAPNVAIWHIGRFAVSAAKTKEFGSNLFKILLVCALQPVIACKNALVIAECDRKLCKVLQLLEIPLKRLGKSIDYLGSETIPVSACVDDISYFYYKNEPLISRRLAAIA